MKFAYSAAVMSIYHFAICMRSIAVGAMRYADFPNAPGAGDPYE
jgi:hypothetical protein